MSTAASPAALEVTGLCKSFGGLQVTRSVDLRVATGERHLLIGPNGAGKTTLFNLIAGDLRADAGRISVHGDDVTRHSTAARAQRVASRARTRSSRCSAATISCTTSSWRCSDARRCAGGTGAAFANDLGRCPSRALAVLDSVGLADQALLPLEQTSYGEKRRLEIAMGLAQSAATAVARRAAGRPPPLPSAPPSPNCSRASRAKITIVMIEHDMQAALAFADRITLLHYGEVITAGTRQQVVDDPRTKQIYLGH